MSSVLPSPSALRSDWGRTAEGFAVETYTISSGSITVCCTNYGARLLSVEAPDRLGHRDNVVLGYGDCRSYEADTKTYMGSLVGRFANRIAKGTFVLDEYVHKIPRNLGGHTLHGGTQGFDRHIWTMTSLSEACVELTHTSHDGDMGFPGELSVSVQYHIENNTLFVEYRATTDRATVVNLSQHAYFNLAGEGKGNVLDHELWIDADEYLPTDYAGIPTGEFRSVEGTAFDFRSPTAIGVRIAEMDDQLTMAGGYDHHFVVPGEPGDFRIAAMVTEPITGRALVVRTTEPGLQFYSGNSLRGETMSASGKPYLRHSGFCLETQHCPDSPNQPHFPSTVLRPGEKFRSMTSFTFGLVS